MERLEDMTYDAIPETFELLMEGINSVELPDSLQRTQFEQVKKELVNLKKLYNEVDSAEFQDTQRWLVYSLEQISNELPPGILARFEYLFSLLKKEGRI